MNERIRKIRESLSMSREAFGKELGVSGDVINNVERGRVEAKEYILKLICRVFNVSEAWLRTGEGEPFLDENEFSLDRYMEEREATDLETQIVKAYFSIDPGLRHEMVERFKQTVVDGLPRDSVLDEPPAYGIPHPGWLLLNYGGKVASAGTPVESFSFDGGGMVEVPDTAEARAADFAVGVNGDSMEPTFSDGDILLVKKDSSVTIGKLGIFQKGNTLYVKELGKSSLLSHNPDYGDVTADPDSPITCIGEVLGKTEIYH